LKELNNIPEEVSKHSHFLSTSFDDSRYTPSDWILGSFRTDKRLLIMKLRDICVGESNIIETENITISTEHPKETYKILNAFFGPIIAEVNIGFVTIFGNSSFIDMVKSYSLFYKKFNDMKFEYVESEENFILIYDHKPIHLRVDKVVEVELANFSPHTYPYSNNELIVEYKYQKELHNVIKFNIIDNPLKLERKLKIEKLSEPT